MTTDSPTPCLSTQAVNRWVSHLRNGQVLVCPTETQYGLLADALDEEVVRRLCVIKGRPDKAPIAVLLPRISDLSQVAVNVSPLAMTLAKAHWPGALTLVLQARAGLPSALVADGKIGVRVPGPSSALELVRAFGGPLTATSANLSGQPPVQGADGAREVFGDEVAGIVAGPLGSGIASTVLDASGPQLRVLRAGAVPFAEQIP